MSGPTVPPVPPLAELVGVWARAMTQLWEMGTAWVDMTGEQGYVEQGEQRSWSTSVWFPRHPGRDGRLEWTGLTDLAGQEQVARALVDVRPAVVAAGDGMAELVVSVSHPVAARTHHYRLWIWDAADRPSTERRYCRGFGVPGAGG